MGSSDNKYAIGVSQILEAHCAAEQDSITIGVGDAAYSNCGYIRWPNLSRLKIRNLEIQFAS